MQSLYSYFSSPTADVKLIEKEMIKSINSISEIYLILISLLIELSRYTADFIDMNKSKHLPTSSDVDVNTRFINNRVISLLKKDNDIMPKLRKISSIWKVSDIDIIRKVFVQFIKSDEYQEYISNIDDNFDIDKALVQALLDNFILDNEMLHYILEERSIFWIDDLPFVAIFLKSQIDSIDRNHSCSFSFTAFKNQDDKMFSVNLFKKTITHADHFEELIQSKSENWDIDRIANMDILILKMALTEITEFPEIPIKVTFNEYIEISKYYSTANSRVFINGILDKIVKDFSNEGRINKIGRGLI